MNPRDPASQPRIDRLRRRGSVYILVLGSATLVTIVGLSASAIVRSQIRTTQIARDWNAAGTIAEAGVEIANAYVNVTALWRTRLAVSNRLESIDVNGNRVTLSFVDETDGNIAAGSTDPVRVYADARCGDARRITSALIEPAGQSAMSVLSTCVHSAGTVNVNSRVNTTMNGGPISSNLTLSVGLGAIVTGSVRAPVVTNLGLVSGGVTLLASPLPMPDQSAWTDLAAIATTIDYALLSGHIEKVVLSPTSNPFGVPNPSGVYRVVVPSGKNLKIWKCRIDATLLIDTSAGSTVETDNEVLWQPQSGGIALLVRTSLTSTVTLKNADARISESSINANLNPPASPYQGFSNSTQTDFYPTGIRGLIHVMGPGTTTLKDPVSIVGTVLSEGPIIIDKNTSVTIDPSLTSAPPKWYAGPAMMRVRPGSYRWETKESLIARIGAAGESASAASLQITKP